MGLHTRARTAGSPEELPLRETSVDGGNSPRGLSRVRQHAAEAAEAEAASGKSRLPVPSCRPNKSSSAAAAVAVAADKAL
jgi:hypothetical protein